MADRTARSWTATIAGLVLVACVILLGMHLHRDNSPTRIDAEATRRLVSVSATHGVEPRDTYHDIAAIGAAGPIVVLVGLMVAWAWSHRDPAGLAVAIAGPVIAIASAEHIVKPLVDRRVLSGSLSYPSGTTTATAAVATVAVWLVWLYAGPRLAALAALPAALVSGSVAIAVVGLSWHYFTDSVAGVLYGTGVVLLVGSASLHLAQVGMSRT